ncbi:arylamine N-acetyltransferase 2 [Aspergillus avenaceus]|uniref:Arylamine N-acetyltransferase 2 n=1 Tax=Aspergillus avenaceus TaxID=36643 RepID=A0A5N6U5A8_ASPAV|nr:arylamine N-acetyltransferase 2 [Aspergillus avenaceus]
MEAFRQATPEPSAYSQEEVTTWLRAIGLPHQYTEFIKTPGSFPKTAEALRTLMRCQISTFPYENLSVHYSPTHLVDIRPHSLYEKMVGQDRDRGRGGYCMELSILFHHMLRGLGFHIYMTGVRNRTRTDGVPQGQYVGWTHINNIVHLPSGEKFSVDVAFGGDGPTSPLPLVDTSPTIQNLGPQQVRLVHDNIPKQRLKDPKLWVYQYRNGADREWNSFYSFAEIEFFQEDYEVQNWWTAAKTLHRWTVLLVRFLREGEPVEFDQRATVNGKDATEVTIVGKVMLVNDVVKVNMGGKTSVVHTFETEEGRLQALKKYFGITLTETEKGSIRGWDMALA